VLAQEEARLLNHNFIGTEHILLGLIHEGERVAAQALEALGVTLVAVRTRVEETVGLTAAATTGSPRFTPRAKQVLELSLREALQLGHNYIGTEHMLLGVVREGQGVAAQVLVSLGADLPQIRQQVIAALEGQLPPEAPEAVTVRPLERRDGPRCPACRSPLAGQVVYRVLAVPLAEQAEASEAIDVVFVYCLRCGVAVAHTPAGPLDGHLCSSTATASAPIGQFSLAHQPARVIGEGAGEGNVRWTLRAGGDDNNYSTTFRIEDEAGPIDEAAWAAPSCGARTT
jgi:Clp amino terminal domain, pathogenicity island component